VARPSANRPIALVLTKGSLRVEQRKRLCWSAVPGAVGYRLWVSRIGTREERSSCVWLTLAPGRYTWRVAALVHGVTTYTGPYSRPAVFTVPSLSLPASRPATRRRKPASALVAALLPPRRTSSPTRASRPVAAVTRPSAPSSTHRTRRALRAGGGGHRIQARPRPAGTVMRRPVVEHSVRVPQRRPARARPAYISSPPRSPAPLRPTPPPAVPPGPIGVAVAAPPSSALSGNRPAGLPPGPPSTGSSGPSGPRASRPAVQAAVVVSHRSVPDPTAPLPHPTPVPTASPPPSGLVPVPQAQPAARPSRAARRP
jgi:hypothetical protein